jgi:hypothetical protein
MNRAQAGGTGTTEVQIIRLVLNPFCYAIISTPFPPAGAIITQLQSGTAAQPSIQRLQLSAAPYAGTFSFTISGVTYSAPYNIAQSDFQKLIGPSIFVVQTGQFQWDFQWAVNGAQAPITANVTGLSVPIGVSGQVAINTTGIFEAFAGTTADSLLLTLEIKVTWPTQLVQTFFRVSFTVFRTTVGGTIVPVIIGIYGVFYAPGLTGTVGGGAANLDGIQTVWLGTNSLLIAIINFASTQWQLLPGPADPADPGQVPPADYNSATNNRHWLQVA